MLMLPDPTATTTASAPSSRSHRLRGFNYLRNYTSHLHSHSNGSHNSSSTAANSSRSHFSGERSPNLDLNLPGARINEADSDLRPRQHSGGEGPLPIFSAFTGSPPTAATTTESRLGWLSAFGGDGSSAQTDSQQRTESPEGARSAQPSGMTRNRDSTGPSPSMRNSVGSNVLERAGISASDAGPATKPQTPSIRFIPHQDPRAQRPSLSFSAITRTLPDETSVIRVGRYSERDNHPESAGLGPSAAPVGFKSKVVSRRHCEFWYSNQRWWIRDVKSSSGTFLNHIRLSQPGMESPPYEIKDGDVVQLGIDFRGGEEMIFRCVKIRVECNRGWQKGLNSFNKQTYKRLKNLAKDNTKKDSDAASTHNSECSICLMSIAPCQSLFVAPCSHVWHFKCIRQLLNDVNHYPNFLCPNCRAVADLEADVDEPQDFSESDDEVEKAILESKSPVTTDTSVPPASTTPRASQLNAANPDSEGSGGESNPNSPNSPSDQVDDTIVTAMLGASLNDNASQATTNNSLSPNAATSISARVGATPRPIPVPQRSGAGDLLSPLHTPSGLGAEGPLTPRNDVGPFILDGSAGRNRRATNERTVTTSSNESD